jgi:two-component system, OmpR family, KDP operon response regulator KdpE
MQKTRVLVVDDEPKMVRLVREILSAAGYEVLAACSGEQAIEQVAGEQPVLVLLDILLSYGSLDGYQTARRLREFSDVPIIMLTARARESDLLQGFEAGADDYITKPFSAKELLARIQAVLRRSRVGPPAAGESQIDCGNLHINLASHRVRVGEGEVHLTATEYSLLHELATHLDQVLLHEQLLTNVWGQEYRDDLDYLRSYIRYLRQKIEANPAEPKLILTVPGIGYMLAQPE